MQRLLSLKYSARIPFVPVFNRQISVSVSRRNHCCGNHIWISSANSTKAEKCFRFLLWGPHRLCNPLVSRRRPELSLISRVSFMSTDISHDIQIDREKKKEELTKEHQKNDSSSSIDDDSESSSDSDAENIASAKNVPSSAKEEPTLDVDAELLRYDYEEFGVPSGSVEQEAPVETPDKKFPIPLTRGQSGVYDIGELVALLKDENVVDVCAIHVPPEYKYVDYMVIATGRSTRHLRAVAALIKWAYKKKRCSADPESVKIEGEDTTDWLAMDLGNIAVHLFLRDTRKKYDLETLWTVGADFDDKTQLEQLTQRFESAAATSLEEFSFDDELERVRQLRREQDENAAASRSQGTVSKPERNPRKERVKRANSDELENVAGWHDVKAS